MTHRCQFVVEGVTKFNSRSELEDELHLVAVAVEGPVPADDAEAEGAAPADDARLPVRHHLVLVGRVQRAVLPAEPLHGLHLQDVRLFYSDIQAGLFIQSETNWVDFVLVVLCHLFEKGRRKMEE